jgi:hypothetical protein
LSYFALLGRIAGLALYHQVGPEFLETDGTRLTNHKIPFGKRIQFVV